MSKRADIVRWFETALALDQRTRAATKDLDAFLAAHPSLLRGGGGGGGGGVAMTVGIDHTLDGLHAMCHDPAPRAAQRPYEVKSAALAAELRARGDAIDARHDALEAQLAALAAAVAAGEAAPQKTPRASVVTPRPSAQPSEVTAFDAFLLRHGGPTGGWAEDDHGEYLRQMNQKTTNNKTIAGKSLGDIAAHDAFYVEYTQRLAMKRDAVLRWKVTKNADEENQIALETAREGRMAAGKKSALRQATAQENVRRAETAAQLAAWKKQQAYAAYVAGLVANEGHVAEKEREAAARAKLRDDAKAVLAARDRARAEVAAQHRATVEGYVAQASDLARAANLGLVRRRCHDAEVVEKRKEMCLAAEKKRTRGEVPIVRSASAQRSFERLVQPLQRSSSVAPREGNEPTSLLRGKTYQCPTSAMAWATRKGNPLRK